jgi:hypothetical protein
MHLVTLPTVVDGLGGRAAGCFPLGFFGKDSGMSDKTRWRYGDRNPVVSAVDSASVIEIGDLLYQERHEFHELGASAKPASMVQYESRPELAGKGDEAYEVIRQERFAEDFLGVAMQRSRSGDTDPVRVATTGVFEFDCPSGTFELGDMMGVDYELHGGHDEVNDGKETIHLLSQSVAPVSASKYAIGRIAKRVATAATTVLIDIRSMVMTGGI